MQRSIGFPGWCALCRWTAVGAISVGTAAVLGAATSDHRPAPTVVQLAAQPGGSGLDWPGWTVRDPAEQRRSLDLLLSREKDRRTAPAAASVVSRTTATASPSAVPVPPSALGRGTTLAAPQAVSVAITYALAQVGKPYVWGATGPDSYDCSGLVQRSYAMAGVALPRTSREQARVGTAVDLPDLLPGDLLFWAYDPSDLSTVHHVALYLGDGKIVQAPQPGEFVEVTTMWLSGYAGAVRVATGPATAALPPVPVGVPGTGITPVGDAMPDGSPPPSVAPTADIPPRPDTRPGSTQNGTTPDGTTPGTSSPGTSSPGTTPPGTSSPGTSSPGTSSPGTSSPGTTSPGTSSPGTSSPGTSSPGTTSPTGGSTGDGSSPAGSHEPTGSASGTSAPATSSAAPSTTSAPTSSAPTSSAPTSSAPTSSAPTSRPPGTTEPAPSSPAAETSNAAPAATSSSPQPSVSPSSATPSPT